MARVSDAVEIRKLISSEMLVAEVRLLRAPFGSAVGVMIERKFSLRLYSAISELWCAFQDAFSGAHPELRRGFGTMMDFLTGLQEKKLSRKPWEPT